MEEKKAEFIRQLEKYRHLEPGQLVEEAGESLERLRDNFTDTLLERLDALELSQLKKRIDEIKEAVGFQTELYYQTISSRISSSEPGTSAETIQKA